MQNLKTLVDLAMTEKYTLLCGTVLLIMSSMITMALPFGLGQIVDNLLKADGVFQTHQHLTNICLSFLAIAFIQALCSFARSYLMDSASDRITNTVRTEVFSAILKQEISFFDKNRTGELISRLSSDTNKISYCVTKNIAIGLQSVFQAIVGLSLMTYQSPGLTRISLTIVPAFAIISIAAGYYMKTLRTKLQDELAYANQVAEERISNIRTVRAFCQEDLEAKTYQARLIDALNLGSIEAWVRSLFVGLTEFVNALIIVTVFYFGGEMAANNSITIGTLSAFCLYVVYVGKALNGLSSFYTEFLKGQGASMRLWEIITRTPSISLTDGEIPSESIAGTLRFHNVSFAYPTRPEVQILDNVSLDIPAGSNLAIVGPSGTGKTTLVSLMLRFYDPTSGTIKLDGTDISRLSPEWLRQQIGMVSQEPVLFSGSIRDNILYGVPNAEEVDDKRLYQVAEESGAYEFIRRFEDQYETVVGERGVMLSGGQRQRIAIARALIKNPKILIFDEATSSLDAENEFLVQEALERIAKNRTVIIIAHRLSTIKNANKIAVVADGKCAEVGTYEDLMTIPYGKFRKLVERQTINKPVKV